MGEDPLLQTGTGASSAGGVSIAAEHLPIGEVLSLLQEEFPDVTISKIRFLESQGLIQPERTASGYRRFSASDIERLQWILRQQRDHFLPLKVIRKMLDEGVDRYDPGGGPQPTLFSASVEAQADAEVGDEDDGDDEPAGATPSDPTARHRSAAHPAVASAPARREPPRPAERTPVRSGAPAAPSTATPSEPRPGAPVPAAPASKPAAPAAEAPAPAQDTPPGRPPYETPADVVAALQEDPRPSARPEPKPAPRGSDRPVRRRRDADAVPEDTQLTADELCSSAGIEPALLAELERFGLIQNAGRVGERVYGASALEVARLAARYAELGVEPRHLRMYLVAAEREAGMVEQLAVPLLKQRNPKAREHASELASELAELGADLHRSLLRRELGHDLLG